MRRWIIVASIIILIGALAYALYASTQAPLAAPSLVEERGYPVTFEVSYDEGVHTIEGTVLLATPCQQVTATGTVVGNGIRIELIIPPDEGICLQREESREFSVEVEAPEEAAIAVFVNGTPAP